MVYLPHEHEDRKEFDVFKEFTEVGFIELSGTLGRLIAEGIRKGSLLHGVLVGFHQGCGWQT